MSPKASEPHSSKLQSCGTEPSQGPNPASLLGGPEQILNQPEVIRELGAVMCRSAPPLRHSSICGSISAACQTCLTFTGCLALPPQLSGAQKVLL